MNALIIGCSRRKTDSRLPCHALDLYQGGCVPSVRSRISPIPHLRQRVFILSAEHGLLGSDDLILPYDRVLTLERAEELRPSVARAVRQRILIPFAPPELLVVLEPLYFVLLADLLFTDHPVLHWITDPITGWPNAVSLLDAWGWKDDAR